MTIALITDLLGWIVDLGNVVKNWGVMAEVWQFGFQDPTLFAYEIMNFQHKKYIEYLNCIIYYADNIFICRVCGYGGKNQLSTQKYIQYLNYGYIIYLLYIIYLYVGILCVWLCRK